MGEEGGHKTAEQRERKDEGRRPNASRLPSFHETARPPFHRAGQRCSASRQKEVELLGGVGDARWTLATGGGGGEVVRRRARGGHGTEVWRSRESWAAWWREGGTPRPGARGSTRAGTGPWRRLCSPFSSPPSWPTSPSTSPSLTMLQRCDRRLASDSLHHFSRHVSTLPTSRSLTRQAACTREERCSAPRWRAVRRSSSYSRRRPAPSPCPFQLWKVSRLCLPRQGKFAAGAVGDDAQDEHSRGVEEKEGREPGGQGWVGARGGPA